MQKLELFHAHHNFIHGKIPIEFYTLKKLKYVNFNYNNLTGKISKKVGELTELITFLFEKNLLKGPLPSTLKNLKNLRDFHIFDSYPSRMILSPRGFLRKKFECDFNILPSLGIQCVCWDEEEEEVEEEEER